MNTIQTASLYIGCSEHDSAGRKTLIRLFRAAGLYIDPANTPWCAAFVGGIECKCGRKGTGKLNARSYLTYGTEVDIDDAQPGDICVFSRTNSPVFGHVAYYLDRVDDNNIKILGGNQSDKVCVEVHSLDTLLGVRRCL